MLADEEPMAGERVLEGVSGGVVGLGLGPDDASEGGEEAEDVEGLGRRMCRFHEPWTFGGGAGLPVAEGRGGEVGILFDVLVV